MLSYCVSSATTWCFFSTVHIAGTCLSLELELLAPCCSDRSFRLAGARRYKWKITIRAFRRDGLAESVEARCLRGQIHFLGGSHVSDHGVGPRGCHVLEELKILNVASDCEESTTFSTNKTCAIFRSDRQRVARNARKNLWFFCNLLKISSAGDNKIHET